ncbi:hypothetical protein HDF13_003445 [Edaphobacter lichenicola]|uniref:Uncharacterized protein n=1 Tax=Tunturiibacter gelidiferens TaxID=3069689 RepID=A0ACC5P2P0_9BACT|nr:hypothetical protein [Edaphobacter lichenicola]
MNWFGSAKQVEVVEQGDLLLIKATGTRRAVDLLVPLFLAVWGYVACRNEHWVSLVFVLFVFGSSVWFLFRDKGGELRVTDTEIVASGDLGGWGEGYVRFGWADISGLEYRQGEEDSNEGLYVRTGRWHTYCVMAGLNREQSEEVDCSCLPALSLCCDG